MKKIDLVRFVIILITVFLLFEAMPVHFFADNYQYLNLARYYSQKPLEIFYLYPNSAIRHLHPAVEFRPFQRLYWAICYKFSGLDPIFYNVVQGIFFLVLVISAYNITYLFTSNKTASFLSVLFFLLHPPTYKLVHWLGIATLFNLSLMALSLYFLFRGIKDNSSRYIFAGVVTALPAFLAKVVPVFLIPLLFSLFFLFHKNEYGKAKKKFALSMFWIIVIAVPIALCHAISLINLKAMGHYMVFELFSPRIGNILTNVYNYRDIFYNDSFPVLFFICLCLFLFRFKKASLFCLLWIVLQIGVFLPIKCVSSKYFIEASLPISIFLGVTISSYIKQKMRKSDWIFAILLCLGILFSFNKFYSNIKAIQHTFDLAKTSYADKTREMVRLKALPKNATIYVDKGSPRVFYNLTFCLIDRRDVKIEFVDNKDTVDPSLFFESDTVIKNEQITDKTGNWRF